MENKNFVDICPVCKQGVSKADMDFQKGKVFHSQCFTEHGSSFPTPNKELAYLSAKTRIELVQTKNLMVRTELGELKPPKNTAKKAKSPKKKPKKTHAKKHKIKSKPRSRKIKARKGKSKGAKSKKVRKRR